MKKISQKVKDNLVLKKMFDEDTFQLSNPDKFGENVQDINEKRRRKLWKIIDSGKIKTGVDYYRASMILQHVGYGIIEDTKKAIELAKKSMELKYELGRWMYAYTLDRWLIFTGKKQKFGTQYEIISSKKKTGASVQKQYFRLCDYNKKTTDSLRARYNVLSLKRLKADAKEMTNNFLNRKS